MSSRAEIPTRVPTGPLEAALDLAPLAAELAEQTERERRLPKELVEQLRAAGLFRLAVPEALNGAEVAPGEVLESTEALARADMSAGWCVSIAATTCLLAAHLPHEGAAEAFGDPDTVAGGVWAPNGRAVPEGDGLRVSGRWGFCSGVGHCDWLLMGCRIEGGEMRLVAFPVSEVEVQDTWHVSGLRGTGSHDIVADGVLVPARRTASLSQHRPVIDRPLYRFPLFGFFAASIAAPALGNARGAIDDLTGLAGAKTPQGARRRLAERSTTQAAVAQAKAALGAARCYLRSATAAAWEAAQGPDQVPTALRVDLRLAATHAARTAADVTRAVYDLGGGTAIYDASPLSRRFRDAHTATAHVQVGPASWELPGRLLLGLDADTATL